MQTVAMEQGADLNIKDGSGWTALHYAVNAVSMSETETADMAAESEHPGYDIVRLLIDAVADLKI